MGFLKNLFGKKESVNININEKKVQSKDSKFSSIKKDLTKQFGEEASDDDVNWRILNQTLIEHASRRDWGLYRNTKFQMAEQLIKEGKHKDGLATLFEVCFLDINGCENRRGVSPEMMKTYNLKEFSADNAMLALGIVSRAEGEMEKLILDDAGAKKLFIEINNRTKPKKDMPFTTEQAWDKLAERFHKNKKTREIGTKGTDIIVAEINKNIKEEEYGDVVALIMKLKSKYTLKKQTPLEFKEIEVLLPRLLGSESVPVKDAAESLLLAAAKKDKSFLKIAKEYTIKNKKEFIECQSHFIGQLASIDASLVKPFVSAFIKNLQNHPEWNIRRFSALNLGRIGEEHPELVKYAIPIMIDYLKKPVEVTKREPVKFKAEGATLSMDLSPEKMLGVNQSDWLSDSYLDSLGMIAKGDKSLILKHKPLFEEISCSNKSGYSCKKAQKVLDALKK